MLIETPINLRRGDYIEVLIPEAAVAARVVWTKGRHFGLRTAAKLDLGRLAGPRAVRGASATDKPADLSAQPAARPAPQKDARMVGRRMEYLSVASIAVGAAVLIGAMLYALLGQMSDKIAAHLDVG